MRPAGARKAAVAASAVALAMLTACSSAGGVDELAPRPTPSTQTATTEPPPTASGSPTPSPSSAAQRVVAVDTALRAALVKLAAAAKRRDESMSYGAARGGIGAGLAEARSALSATRSAARNNLSCSTVAARVANVRRGASHSRGAHAALLRRTATTRARMREVAAARAGVERQMTALTKLVRATSEAPTVTPESVVRAALSAAARSQAEATAVVREVESKAAGSVGNAAVISSRAATIYARVC